MTPATGPRHFDHREFSAEVLAKAKKASTVSVCLPAHDEARTIGCIVETIRADLVDKVQLVDEVLVADDRSTDATAAVAASAGATVVTVATPPRSGPGKGAAMATALAESRGDLVVFLDADIEDFSSDFVVGLLGPLIGDRSIGFVKGAYRRPLAGMPGEGGRVTELTAKPLLTMLHPHLVCFAQPLAGEIAARRAVLEGLAMPSDYGVDVALLIDAARRIGRDAMAEVDLGERRHRNRVLSELVPQAHSVARAIMERARISISSPGTGNTAPMVVRYPTTAVDRRVGVPPTDGQKLG